MSKSPGSPAGLPVSLGQRDSHGDAEGNPLGLLAEAEEAPHGLEVFTLLTQLCKMH